MFLQSDASGAPEYQHVADAFHGGFLNADAELIRSCHRVNNNYSSSTGVACFITNNVLTVAHVGDSRVSQPYGSFFFSQSFLTRIPRSDSLL